MSKQPPTMDEDLPPPYSAAATLSTPDIPHDAAPSQSSLFAGHLSSLRSQIASEEAAYTSARDHRDSQTLALLVPHVEELLSSIAALRPPPTLVEATFVPEDAVGQGWRFTDVDHRRPGEVAKLIRVERDLKLEGDRKPAPRANDTGEPRRSEFDEWGRFDDGDDVPSNPETTLWWSDEDMARRLARHLQPDRPTASVDRQTVRAQVVQNKESKKASRWSLFKKDEPQPPPSFAAPARARDDGEDIAMTVGAEEVTFRKENDMGIWESKTGWGLVVRVRIRKS